MKVLNLVPAYGRDYNSAETASNDWTSGKDWQIRDVSCYYNGCYCSERDSGVMKGDGYTHVKLNFNGNSIVVEI